MKNKYALHKWQIITALIFAIFSVETYAQQVTGIYTDYLGYWHSTNTNQNPVQPENSHNALGFTYGGITYSTGVNDIILDNHSVTYSAQDFRALPILSLPTSGGGSYWLGFGQLYDGIDNGADTSSSSPFQANPSASELASYLTDGPHGLNLGTYFTNIPNGTNNRFELSTAGLDLTNIGDGVPDIFVSQIAQPGSTDQLRFVDASGTTVGNSVSLSLGSAPSLGTWRTDLYQFNSQPSSQINNVKTIRFAAIELSQFGINASNVTDAVALIYVPGGSSDPAFIAYNEPSIPVASNFAITAQPTTSNCDGSMPSSFTIQITDDNGNAVAQSGFEITASIYNGPGELLGTLTKTSDSSGQVIFDDLVFEVGGDHTIAFNSSSLKEKVSATIADATGCGDATWTGNIDSDWNDVGNWNIAEIPNANYNVTIPTGLTNYPVLDINTGADNLILGDGATINLNGYLFSIQGTITLGTGASIDGSSTNSEINFSGQNPQSIPAGFFNGNIANLTIENTNGVTNNTSIVITEILNIKSGQFNTGNDVTLTCDFTGNTAQIDEVGGSISGNITTEQCFPAKRAFRFIASSVTTTSTYIRDNWQEGVNNLSNTVAANQNPNPGYGTHITGSTTGANGFDATTSGNPSLFELDNVNQTWFTTTNTNSTTLTAGYPYRIMIRGDRSIDVLDNDTSPTNTRLRNTGTVATGNVNFSSGFSSTEGHFNFFGNPYHAIVDMTQVLENAGSTNVNTLYYYIWDPTQGTQGAYVTIDLQTNTSTMGDADKFLQPMQAAFFLTGDKNTTPVLSFLESNKNVDQVGNSVFSTNTANKSLEIKLFTADAFTNQENPSDALKIKFAANADNSFNYKDAPKMYNLDESMARDINGNLASIENRAFPTDQESLPLFMYNYQTTDYVFEFDLKNLDEYEIFVKDNFNNTLTQISASNPIYNFQVDIANQSSLSTEQNRFELVFTDTTLSNQVVNENNITVYPNPTNDRLFITTANTTKLASISIYNLLGKQVQANLNLEQNSIDMSHLSAGVYLLELTTTTGNTITKKIIKK